MGLCSCSGKFTLQKRKYTKGYYLAFSSHKQAKHAESLSSQINNDKNVITTENKFKACSVLQITTDKKAETENLLSAVSIAPLAKPRLRSYAPEKITNVEIPSQKKRVKLETKPPSLILNSIPGFGVGFFFGGIALFYFGLFVLAIGGDPAFLVGLTIMGIGVILTGIGLFATILSAASV